MSLRLVTALPDTPWEARVVAAYDAAEAAAVPPVVVVRRTVDTAELLAVALAGLADVVVVSSRLPMLDAQAVAVLSAAGVAVVLAVPAGEAAVARRARALGPAALVEVGADPADLAVVLHAAHEQRSAVGRGDPAAPGSAVPGPGVPSDGSGTGDDVLAVADDVVVPRPREVGPELGDVVAPVTDRVDRSGGSPSHRRTSAFAGTPAGPAGDASPEQVPGSSTVVAVWGPNGAPGRTTTSIVLAERLGGRLPTLLVDLDPYGGAAAQMLGMLDEGSGFLDACRHASVGRLDRRTLVGVARTFAPGTSILSGYTRTDRWPEASASASSGVIQAARRAFPAAVVDCGFSLDEDEVLSYDSVAPQRNAATLTALAEADRVVVVSGADPVSLQRMVRGWDRLREVIGSIDDRLVLVVNGLGGPGSAGQAEVSELLRGYLGRPPDHLLPYDVALGRALLAGRSPGEHAPRSPFVAAVEGLAAALVPSVTAGSPSSTGLTRWWRRSMRP